MILAKLRWLHHITQVQVHQVLFEVGSDPLQGRQPVLEGLREAGGLQILSWWKGRFFFESDAARGPDQRGKFLCLQKGLHRGQVGRLAIEGSEFDLCGFLQH